MEKSYSCMLVGLLGLLSGCFLFHPTVSVDVPDAYVGWCYIIPVKDTVGFTFDKVRGDVYRIDKDGIVYVPEVLIERNKDVRVDIYEKGKLITADVRYGGHVFTSNSYNAERDHYLHFFIPVNEERGIKASDAYWRGKNYSGIGNRRFDSLLAAKRIVFK